MATKLSIEIIADTRDAQIKIRELAKEATQGFTKVQKVGLKVNRVFGTLDKGVRGLSRSFFNLKTAVAGAVAVLGAYKIFDMARGFVEAGAELERFRTQLTAVLGGNAQLAEETLRWVREFAARTPFTTQEVIRSFVMLRSVGIDVTQDMMETIGNVAYVFNRKIEDVAAAMISFETEVLRRLGVEIRRTTKEATIRSGELVRTVKNDAAEIREALLEIWAKRFPDAMKRAETEYEGMIALLKSLWWEFRVAVAESGVFDAIKRSLKAVVDYVAELRKRGDFQAWAKEIGGVLQGVLPSLIEGIGRFFEFLSKVPAMAIAVTTAVFKMAQGFTAFAHAVAIAVDILIRFFTLGQRRLIPEIFERIEDVGVSIAKAVLELDRIGPEWARLGLIGEEVKRMAKDVADQLRQSAEEASRLRQEGEKTYQVWVPVGDTYELMTLTAKQYARYLKEAEEEAQRNLQAWVEARKQVEETRGNFSIIRTRLDEGAKKAEELKTAAQEVSETDLKKPAEELNKALDETLKKLQKVLELMKKTSQVKPEGMHQGGLVGYQSGGFIPGYGGGDRVPALLEPGEFVLRKEVVRALGLRNLEALNRLVAVPHLPVPALKAGGLVGEGEVKRFEISIGGAKLKGLAAADVLREFERALERQRLVGMNR